MAAEGLGLKNTNYLQKNPIYNLFVDIIKLLLIISIKEKRYDEFWKS